MRDLQPTVAGDMEMAPDQPRFMDETVVVESKAVAIRARRATVHQRGSAPRHVVAASRRGQGFGGLVPQAEGESVGRLIGTLARMHGQGPVATLVSHCAVTTLLVGVGCAAPRPHPGCWLLPQVPHYVVQCPVPWSCLFGSCFARPCLCLSTSKAPSVRKCAFAACLCSRPPR